MPPVPVPPEPSRRRRGPALIALTIALLVHLVVLYLPGEDVPSAGFEIPGLDKAVHLTVFAVPAALILHAPLAPAWLLPLAAHAPVSEVLQGTVVGGRSTDPWDAVADLTGVAVGAGVALLARRRRGVVEGPHR